MPFCILLNIVSLYLLIFCMKLETIRGYKLILNPFLRKILISQILAIFGHIWLKNRLSCILLNIGTLDFFEILHEETITGYKLILNQPFFKENSRFADFGHFLSFWLKNDFYISQY